MHVFHPDNASRVEPAGHFGHLAVSDVVPKDVGETFVVQLSYCPPGGGGDKHHHDVEAQLFLVAQGELTFDTGAERFTLRQHEAVLFEPGEPHATINEGASDSLAVVVTVTKS